MIHIPDPQSATTHPYLTVKEFNLGPFQSLHYVAIEDGWRPLCIRQLEHSTILVALVDLSAPLESEVIRQVYPGEDLGAIQTREGVELHFLGYTWNGYYLFLDVKPEEEEPLRRVGRKDLEQVPLTSPGEIGTIS